MAAHFTKNGEEIILGSRHKSFYYYDMMAGKIVNVTPPVKAIDEFQRRSISAHFEISPDNRFIAFVGSQGYIHLFSVKVSCLPATIPLPLTQLTRASNSRKNGSTHSR